MFIISLLCVALLHNTRNKKCTFLSFLIFGHILALNVSYKFINLANQIAVKA